MPGIYERLYTVSCPSGQPSHAIIWVLLSWAKRYKESISCTESPQPTHAHNSTCLFLNMSLVQMSPLDELVLAHLLVQLLSEHSKGNEVTILHYDVFTGTLRWFLVAWHLWSQPQCHCRPHTLCGLQLLPLLVAHHKLMHMFQMAPCLCGSAHKQTWQHVEASCILESNISSVYFSEWIFKCESGLCGYYSMCADLGPILSLRPFLLPSTCRNIVE